LIRDEDSEPLGYSLIIRDTRKQAELEEQMRRSEGLAAASVMAAGLAHEFNNPLAVLSNRIECMQEDVVERCDRCFLNEDLAVLGEHTARLSEVTRDLLRFVQAEDDELEPLALDEMALRLVRLLRQTFSSRNIDLGVVTREGLFQPQGREKAIEAVCMNLLLNAADATPPDGSVTLEVRNAESGGAVQIEVRDTGPGIPPQLHHRIFEPFFTTKAAGRGTGLGLAVCRNIVERHGGQIEVYCPTGGGSRFVVTLPVQQSGII
jgi:signal transduction histidine kinase